MFLASQRISQQRGAALILALMIVSIVVILAATLSTDFLLALRRVENQLQSQQAYIYLRGTEVIARQVLLTDFQSSNEIDHYSEGWLEEDQGAPIEEVPGAAMNGRLSDLQGRFNLNNLVSGSTSGSSTNDQYTPDQQVFIRLLQNLPLDERLDRTQAEKLTRAVVDWIDDNENPDPRGGAESDYYLGLDLPRKAGNKDLISASELMWVDGMTSQIYTALKPFVIALPKGSELNINTASAQVLQAMVDDESSGSVGEQIASERDGDKNNPSQGFATLEEFTTLAKRVTGLQQLPPTPTLGIKSEYFLLNAQVLFLDREFQMRSILHRDSEGVIKVVARSYTDL